MADRLAGRNPSRNDDNDCNPFYLFLLNFSLQNITIIRQGQPLLSSVSLGVPAGGSLLITGHSGSGKTLLLQALAGKVFYQGKIEWQKGGGAVQPKIVYVEQHYYFKNKSNTSGSFYYQQRFNSADAADAETVIEALTKQPQYEASTVAELLCNFGMESLKEASLLQLSSGEHKRFQIIKALLNKPQVLLLDEPYTGLDIASRSYLNTVLDKLAQNGCTIISVSSLKDAATCMTHVAELNNGLLSFFGEMTLYSERSPQSRLGGSPVDQQNEKETLSFSQLNEKKVVQTKLPFRVWGQPAANSEDIENSFAYQSKFSAATWSGGLAVDMQNVTIRYGDKTILHNINWQIKGGEKWLLKGPNGAGKSTLISLITGDNPQAFANNITLFGRRKGSGESIWDIKKNIGYISPEMQWHFDGGTTCRQAVGSGFFDTIGLFRKLSKQQEETIEYWLQQFGVEAFVNKLLRTLPVSKQKLVLLARAIVKNPLMLILDEPCQGLDEQQKQHFLQIIEALCHENRTLIYVSHYASEIPACVEQVIELQAGEATVYRLIPSPLLTEREKAEASEKYILKIKQQKPAVPIY